MSLHRRVQVIADALLTTEPAQRLRLVQAGLAMLILATSVLAMQVFVALGIAEAGPLAVWTVASLGGMAVFFVLMRSGWSRRLRDPSMTLPQMVYAIGCGAVAYALLGAGRASVFPVVMVILAFGLFQLHPRQVSAVGLFAVALFGVVMALMAWRRPETYLPPVEGGHFVVIATMIPAMSLLAARLSRIRERLRRRKQDLAQAMARVQELATRDELTGLVNRRHMQGLLEQERRRCARSGQSFCIAMLDLDHYRAVNQAHGHAAGDEVLRTVAQELRAGLRLSDELARWSGGSFVGMLSDTRAPLARGGLERLRQRVARLRIVVPEAVVAVTLSAGLAEHRAGEPVSATLARAEEALRQAKQQGRDRAVAV